MPSKMELKVNRRLFHKEDVEQDGSIELIYYNDLTDNKWILDLYKGISSLPLDNSRKMFLKQRLFTGNYFALYKLHNPKVIIYKFPNGELRYFLISAESNLIEANDSSLWDSAFSFIKSTRDSMIFSIPNCAEIEVGSKPWLYNPNSSNYCHFCIDYFSPIAAFFQSNILHQIGQDVECPQFVKSDWQNEFYDFLAENLLSPYKINFNYDYCSFFDAYEGRDAIFVFKLQTLYMPVIPNVCSSAQFLRYFLQNKVKSHKSNSKQSDLVFLTRNDARRERIRNIDLIEYRVQKLGGTVINPATLTLKEKFAIFSHSKVIIAESSGCVNYWLLANCDAKLIALIDCNALDDYSLLIGGLTYMTIESHKTVWLVGHDYQILKNSPLGSCTYDVEDLVNIVDYLFNDSNQFSSKK